MKIISTVLSLCAACYPLTFVLAEDQALVNLNLQINRLNFTRRTEPDSADPPKNRWPVFLNLNIPSIFSMRLNTKKDEGTSLGLSVLQPLNRLIKLLSPVSEEEPSKSPNGFWISDRTSGDSDEKWVDTSGSKDQKAPSEDKDVKDEKDKKKDP